MASLASSPRLSDSHRTYVLQSERAALVESVPSNPPHLPPRLSIESKRAQTIYFESFVDEFDARHQNRKLALAALKFAYTCIVYFCVRTVVHLLLPLLYSVFNV